MNICNRCFAPKDISEFPLTTKIKSGHLPYCISCKHLQEKKYRESNKEGFKKAKRKHYEKNKNKIYEACKAYNQTPKGREVRKKVDDARIASPKGKLSKNMRKQLWQALNGRKAGKSWKTLVSYSIEELMAHLEKQFEPWMTWDNYGAWHVDHIKPVCSFDYQTATDKEFQDCWALNNLRPLKAEDNLRKAALDRQLSKRKN